MPEPVVLLHDPTASAEPAGHLEELPGDNLRPTFGQWCTLVGSVVQLAALAYLVMVLR